MDLTNQSVQQTDVVKELFARHGGVHFQALVPAEEINHFVARLSAGKRESMFEVMKELEKAGYISILNDHVFTDGNGVVGGGELGEGENGTTMS
ncbi:hypothetical protein LOK74_19625 [Brevibacillus humidisoli]|uniref:hypothetical protein n=1 Tax=Brevibacillus humidisoli TaxID=2895522 RepID=UPI001E5DC824|nr:hypothetical protein [Brevibacillus humidisoli]UFJ40220.1 hypothetical protein LOK74_19625 [Brevibacillus humidisoli]